MNIRKFQASNMKEALAQIKRELGPDAIVVSTRQVRRGLLGTAVEVTAATDDGGLPDTLPNQNSGPANNSNGMGERDVERIMAPLRSELRSLRTLIRSSAEARHNEDLRIEVAALRQALSGMNGTGTAKTAATLPSLKDVARGKRLASPTRGRVVALVGPTGVGKTTTIAKLAGRDALMDGYDVALISMDTYRVGGEEQMRIFADLIGVPLHIVAEPSQLEAVLDATSRAERVYIDTAGRSPRDSASIRFLEEALRGVHDLEVHLALAATTPPDIMDATYRRFERVGIDRLLFTKLDEANDLTELVRAPARLKRPVCHLTTGQRIPEDIEQATTDRLVELATGGLVPAVEAAA